MLPQVLPSSHEHGSELLGTLNTRRATSSLVRLVEEEKRWEVTNPPKVFFLKISVELIHDVLSPLTSPKMSSGNAIRVCSFLLVVALLTADMISAAPYNDYDKGGHSRGGQRPPTSLPLPPTSREDLRFDGYLEYPHATKALYIHKHPRLLRDSYPVPTAQQSASLTTTQDGRQ
ncbi:uncharacterized protein TNCV_3938251 [Trichonephila clavipes]|nr:uncharacterized protein TNCV_3938251 [Trichonephila clavipes]